MVTTSQAPTTPPWARAVLPPATEFPSMPLMMLHGTVPPDLRGNLYRNGPGRLERQGQRVGHWFDGDGAVLKVQFGAEVRATYRYVQTSGYQAEESAGQFLYGGYGMLPSGPIWRRLSKGLKNAANTSVLALPDRLLALWEGGAPHALDLDTLETQGTTDLQGLNGHSYSAHPKRDLRTGEIFNFGVTPGKQPVLRLYCSDRTGTIQRQGTIPLEGMPLIHDFALVGPYLIFCISPVRLQVLPVLLALKPYSDALVWDPQQGTQILIVDRQTLQVVSRSETDPWFQWHYGNGYLQADGTVALDLVTYPDFQTNQFLKEVASGHTSTPAPGTLHRLTLDPQTARVLSQELLTERPCEFPTVQPHQVGQPHRFTYLSVHRPDADVSREILGAIARFDHQTQILEAADLRPACYPSEPLYAPHPDNPDQGWLLSVVFNADQNQSEVWIWDSDRLSQPPLARLLLPAVIPPGFHGTWQPA